MEEILKDLLKAYAPVAIPWGYLCMIITRAGYISFDDNFRKLFIVFIFASMTHYVYLGLSHICPASIYILYPFSMGILLCAALAWRKKIGGWVFDLMNKNSITNENGNGTVLNSLMTNTSHHVNGITVYMKNGKIYQCSSLGWVQEKYKFGLNIDHTAIAMPVTHIFNSTKDKFIEIWQEDGGIKSDMGTHIMYIPMSEIQNCEFVLEKK